MHRGKSQKDKELINNAKQIQDIYDRKESEFRVVIFDKMNNKIDYATNLEKEVVEKIKNDVL